MVEQPATTNAIYNAAGIRVYDRLVDQDWMLRPLKVGRPAVGG